MALMKADDFRASLRDGRRLYYRGRKVADVTAEPDLAVGVDHAALDYELADDPKHRDQVVYEDPDSGGECTAYYRIPRSPEDLLARSRLIELGTEHGGTIPPRRPSG